METQIVAARTGRGIARVLSYQAAADIREGKLVRLLDSFEPDSQPVHLVTPSARVTPKVRGFLDHATDALLKLDVIHEADGPDRRPAVRRSAKEARR